MRIHQVPLLRDNYGYLLVCEKTNEAAIIDPSEGEPVLQRVAGDVGLAGVSPDWSLGPLVPDAWLIPLELLVLQVGLIATLLLLHRIAGATFPTSRRARKAFVPWACLAIALSFAGAWIMTQPMDMRGMMDMPGHQMHQDDGGGHERHDGH
jgi:hypothetical protein